MSAIKKEFDENEYEELLNDTYGDVEICGLKYPAGHALRELDPIAFRCAMNDNEEDGWICSECGQTYIDEEEAEECCKEELNT
jgi:hypothetical protein